MLGAHLVDWQRGPAVEFQVWAPKRRQVAVVFDPPGGRDRQVVEMTPDGGGVFAAVVPGAGPGMRYWYRLDHAVDRPDPCSRFQPAGPHGPSEVVDPAAYRWHDPDWPGVLIAGQVIYEIHVGAFTPGGTFDATIAPLDALRDLGVGLIQVMPVAEFPGRWNWGYDGVDLYAPAHVYGDAHAFRRFVDAAHQRGLGVILDVVYNHLGPNGNYLTEYSDDYFTARYSNEWGAALNFDGPRSTPVREFFIENAAYWIREFHLDGLRLDATQTMYDASQPHVLAAIAAAARRAAGSRPIVMVGESEPQDLRCVRPAERGGFGLDAFLPDDFHHSTRVAMTGTVEGYYTDYRGTPQELISLVKRGMLYQGQRYPWQGKDRGTVVTDEPASCFVFYTQSHDQVANSPRGRRIHALTTPGRNRAILTLLLLAPETPMLFMGQEFAASSPFFFFADHAGQLARESWESRKRFLAQFMNLATPAGQELTPDPASADTFRRSVLDHGERDRHPEPYRLVQDLIALRRGDPVFAAQRRDRVDGAVLGREALVLRFFGTAGQDRLVIVNMGIELHNDPTPEPLLAPPEGQRWQMVLATEDPRYGGAGAVHPQAPWRIREHEFSQDVGWHLAAHAAIVMQNVSPGPGADLEVCPHPAM